MKSNGGRLQEKMVETDGNRGQGESLFQWRFLESMRVTPAKTLSNGGYRVRTGNLV